MMGSGHSNNKSAVSKTKNNKKQSSNHKPVPTVTSKNGVRRVDKTTTAKSTNQKEVWTEYQLEALKAHNDCRSKHGVAPLTLNKELCDRAQEYAEQLAREKRFDHCPKEKRNYNGQYVGENLAMKGCTGSDLKYPGGYAVQQWYDEIKDYDFDSNTPIPGTGHFTQVVWSSTTELGQGVATYKEGRWTKVVAVARYYPGGNYVGQHRDKVKPLLN